MSVTAYRWTCPLCGKSGVQLHDGPEPTRWIANTIQAHIRSIEDDQHGPKHSCPDEFTVARLSANVSTQTVRS